MNYLVMIVIALSVTACTAGSRGCYCVEGYVTSNESITIEQS